MLKRVKNSKVGDVFCAKIDESNKRYLQYIVCDLTALHSDVIRAFKKSYPIETNPDLSEIINDEVDFYAHCYTKDGIKRELLEKVGNIQDIGQTEHIIFKVKGDFTKPKIQNDWRIWKINGEIIEIGELKGKNRQAYLGLVFQPKDIVHKLITGSHIGVFAQFE